MVVVVTNDCNHHRHDSETINARPAALQQLHPWETLHPPLGRQQTYEPNG